MNSRTNSARSSPGYDDGQAKDLQYVDLSNSNIIGKVLLSKRANTGYEDGNYGLVAGHVETGETLRRAMAREALEEAGLVIVEADIELALTMHRLSPSSNPPGRLDFFMTVSKYTGEVTNKEPGKCSDLAWFGRNNPPENLIAYIREALNLIAEDVRYSEYGW